LKHFYYIFLLVCCLLPLQDAQAYVRSKTSAGYELFWNNTTVRYHINDTVPAGIDKNGAIQAIQESFAPWAALDCSCITFLYQGVTKDVQLGYDNSNPSQNKNIVLFRTDSWSHGRSAVAVTSTVFQQRTGEIVAFDMEINSAKFVFSLDGKPRGSRSTIDLRNTLTHEVGHALGLDHSQERESTMFASAPPNETKKRDLHQDDIDGLCHVYQKTQSGCKIARSLNIQPASGCGCQISRNDSHTTRGLQTLGILLLLSLLVIFFRRKKQQIKP